MKSFDDELFTEQPGWDLLVRGPINQSGREIKRNRNKKHLSEESDSDNGSAKKRQKVVNSQADFLCNEEKNNSDESDNQANGHDMDE